MLSWKPPLAIPTPALFGRYTKTRLVFTEEQERALGEYIKLASDIYFGLTPTDIRTLAYECAVKFEIDIPEVWKENKRAGKAWFTNFMKRNSDLSQVQNSKVDQLDEDARV